MYSRKHYHNSTAKSVSAFCVIKDVVIKSQRGEKYIYKPCQIL